MTRRIWHCIKSHLRPYPTHPFHCSPHLWTTELLKNSYNSHNDIIIILLNWKFTQVFTQEANFSWMSLKDAQLHFTVLSFNWTSELCGLIWSQFSCSRDLVAYSVIQSLELVNIEQLEEEEAYTRVSYHSHGRWRNKYCRQVVLSMIQKINGTGVWCPLSATHLLTQDS